MAHTLRFLLFIIITGFSVTVFAQDGEILGKVTDGKTKEAIINGYVRVTQGGIIKGNAVTDFDGNYSIKPLEAGRYNVMITYVGYDTILVTDVQLSANGQVQQDAAMDQHVTGRPEVVVKAYKVPLVNHFEKNKKFGAAEIKNIPTLQTNDVVGLTPGVYQSQRGGSLQAAGGRSTGSQYIIDGVMVQSSNGIDLPQGSVEEIEISTGGTSAKYGDFSGAVVNITTRNTASKLTGDIRAQHSIDGYNNNLLSFSLAGPLLFKKSTDSNNKTKKPVMGFSLGGDIINDNDRYPTYYQDYIAKPAVLAALQKNPLHIASDNSGNLVYTPATDYITYNDLEQVKRPSHDVTKEIRLNGKVDYQLTDNMHLVAGGSYNYTKADAYSRGLAIFSPEGTPVDYTIVDRGYLRFTQKLGKQGGDTTHKNIISNAYYTIQADYQSTKISSEDPRFKHNIFDYQYVGKFNHSWTPNYGFGFDTASKKIAIIQGNQPTAVLFSPGKENPIMANYTTQYYNSLNENAYPFFVNAISNPVLINGSYPSNAYGIFNSPGSGQTGYSDFKSNQYALSVDASFDLQTGKTRHAIEFGLYYQQRVERSFAAYSTNGANSLWSLMRGYVSSYDNGKLILDKSNPIFLVNGKQYTLAQVHNKVVIPSPSDTIIYNTINTQSSQFDQNLRKKLGYKSNQDINIDNLDPSTFSLSMFTADELLNSGNPNVSYYGYTYTGGTQGTVNFNDFWTTKDANGNYTRPIPAFSPNYIAGYIQDKFTYKDIHFNLGVRVDRYSANDKVLTDPFSEYAEGTVSSHGIAKNTINGGKDPSNLSGNYVVYVDDNTSNNPNIVAYRSGNNWYDPTGKYIENPFTLTQYTGGRDPQPYIPRAVPNVGYYAKITDSNYNPNSAFSDYIPQVTVMPRLSFSFPISDVADFFAHYDIYAQRPYPTTLGIATAYDYTYLSSNSNQILTNANLRSEKTFDYQAGFQQKLTDHSAMTLTAYYKERKDQITVVPYLLGFPTTYYAYGNRDFSSTKGTTISYDYRATNHLSMDIGYTLQFAEGTGSTPYSSNSGGGGQVSPNGILQTFVAAGTPNLRYVSALDYDSRHNINANINYRFKDADGPVVYGKHIFENAGIAIIGKARSGEPFTRYANALGNTVIGGINGSRLPWHYGMDLKLNKDFSIYYGKRNRNAVNGIKPKKPYFLSTYINVLNALNTRDVLGVYGYTGKPDDNGYLNSSYGKQYVPQQINPQSYSNLYSISTNTPGHYNYARTIVFGVEFTF